jgi:Transposase IS116/IS110/IS902 family
MRDLLECLWAAALDTAAAAVPIQDVDRGIERDRRLRRRAGPHPSPRPGPLRARRTRRHRHARRAETDAADRAEPGHRVERPGRCDRAPARCLGTDQADPRGLAARPHPPGRHRSPHGRRPRRTPAHRSGLLHQGPRAVGAAAILAETGNLHRFATARALVKHTGLAPRQKSSGTFTGRTKLTGQGRPSLRLAAWRAVWDAVHTNPVYAARYRHLSTREHNRRKPTQAQTVITAAILRPLHAIITTGQRWDPQLATHGTRTLHPTTIAA